MAPSQPGLPLTVEFPENGPLGLTWMPWRAVGSQPESIVLKEIKAGSVGSQKAGLQMGLRIHSLAGPPDWNDLFSGGQLRSYTHIRIVPNIGLLGWLGS